MGTNAGDSIAGVMICVCKERNGSWLSRKRRNEACKSAAQLELVKRQTNITGRTAMAAKFVMPLCVFGRKYAVWIQVTLWKRHKK